VRVFGIEIAFLWFGSYFCISIMTILIIYLFGEVEDDSDYITVFGFAPILIPIFLIMAIFKYLNQLTPRS
jgi:hypothetical protein